MNNFDKIDKKESQSQGTIKFNKKKKNSKNKFIVLTVLYLVVASLSGIVTAFALNKKATKMWTINPRRGSVK